MITDAMSLLVWTLDLMMLTGLQKLLFNTATTNTAIDRITWTNQMTLYCRSYLMGNDASKARGETLTGIYWHKM